jgi:hypothetical protein
MNCTKTFIDHQNSKRVTNILNRMERILIPDFQQNDLALGLADLCKTSQNYLIDVEVCKQTQFFMKAIDWNLLESDVHRLFRKFCDSSFPEKAQHEINLEISKQQDEVNRLYSKEYVRYLNLRNGQPTLKGKWRKEPYPLRDYEKIEEYVMTSTVDDVEAQKSLNSLLTSLDGFLGQVY